MPQTLEDHIADLEGDDDDDAKSWLSFNHLHEEEDIEMVR